MELFYRTKSIVVLLFIHFYPVLYGKFTKVKLSTEVAKQYGGQVITAFTFEGGPGALSYQLSSKWQILPILHVFPYDMAFPLPTHKDLVNPTNCKAFFQKSVHKIELTNMTGQVLMGMFSGPFPVMFVYADSLTCEENQAHTNPDLDHREKKNDDVLKPNDSSEIKIEAPTSNSKKANNSFLPIHKLNTDLVLQLQLFNPSSGDHHGLSKEQMLASATQHLSAEETGLVGFFQLMTVAYFVGGCICVAQVWPIISQPGPMQSVLQLVTLVAALQFSANLFFFVHLFRFSYNGVGCSICEGLAELLDMGCHYLLLLLLIKWTLAGKQKEHISWGGNTGKMIAGLAGFQLFYFLWCQIESLPYPLPWQRDTQLFRNGLGLGGFGTGTIGVVLFIIRLLLASMFALHLLKASRKERSTVKRDFFATFSLTSLLWFVSYPVLYIIAILLADTYLRYKVITILVSICQALALALLYNLFLSRSLFWEVSSLSGTLPMVMKFDKTYGFKASP